MKQVDNFLAHYGVKGMRWGVHRDRSAKAVEVKSKPGRKIKTKGGQNQSASEDAIKAAIYRQVAKKSNVQALDNKQLQELVQRMNLEQQYANLNRNNVGAGKRIARAILGEVGDKQVNDLGNFVGSHYGDKANAATKIGVGVAKTAVGGGKKKK